MSTAAHGPTVLRARWWGGVVVLTVLGSVLWPLTWPLDRDSFPLSNYPMFAWPRLTTLCTLVADLTAGEAVIAARGEPPVAIPLAGLAEGDPGVQHPFPPARF